MAGQYFRNRNKYYHSYYWEFLSNLVAMPLHFFFFISILLSVVVFTWYVNYESAFEETMNQVKLFFMLSPLILLLLLHFLSPSTTSDANSRNKGWSSRERDSLHRAGGSPWGVALLLVFLLFMISHQSSLHERWFPLVTRCS
ncbi:unnamed protein product [Linum tenue]|uniref:Uncharacterized protein n=1 Tax=Linum tenue TaxID=586396 RepID=A0AAV0Q1X8_9ROSI|nr:unnamed protein product [Linum tenue]